MNDRFLIVNPQGVVDNVIVGHVDMPNHACIPQTEELMRVSAGWIYDPSLDAFVDPLAPALTAFDPDVAQDSFVWSETLGTYVNSVLLAQSEAA